MAITWGSEVRNSSGNGMRLGYEFSQSPSSVGASTSSVSVTLKVYFWSRASVYDSTNSYSISGDFSGSGAASISHSGSDTTLIRTLTRTVSTSYSSTTRVDFSAYITGIAAISGTARVSGSWTVGKRPISDPDAPTNVVVSRSSDARQNVSWTRTNPTTASKPYQSQELRRWDKASGVYRTIANLPASATSYTDSSTGGNTQYRYAVRAKNSAGASVFAYSDYISTTPSAPWDVRARKTAGDIVLTWTNPGGPKITGIEVWKVENGTTWGSPTVLAGSPTSWTHSTPNTASTWAYKLKVRTGEDANDAAPLLVSAFSSQSNTVQLLTNPAAPSKLSPSSVALDATEDIEFKWQHNDVDSTDQTAYELQWRVLGGSTWTTTGKTTAAGYSKVFPAGTFTNGTTIEWQVRTWGDYATAPAYSPWSSTSILTLSARPAATITQPESEVNSSNATIEWLFFDNEDSTQTSFRIRLEDSNGETVYNHTGNGSDTTYTIPLTVADAGEYTVYVSVRDGDGVWSLESAQVFTVNYADPPAPNIELSWDVDLGAVIVMIEHPEPEPGIVYDWTGTPDASESTKKFDGVEVARNYNPDPRATNVAKYRTSGTGNLELMDEDGVPYLRVTETTGGSLYVDPLPNFTQANLGYSVGDTIMVSAQVRVTTPLPMRIKVNGYSGTTVSGGPAAIDQTPEDGWVTHTAEVQITGSVAGGYVRALIWPNILDIPVGQGFEFRNMLVALNTGTEYFDGSTPDTPGEVPVDYAEVWRSADGEDWIRIAEHVPPSTSIVDFIPALDTVNYYKVVTVSPLPSSKESTAIPIIPASQGWIYLNGGPNGEGDFSTVIRMKYEPGESVSLSRDKVRYHFAGRKRPVEFVGEATNLSIQLSSILLDDSATKEDMQAFAYYPAPLCFRDPSGQRVFVGLDETSLTYNPKWHAVSVGMVEVDFDE